MFGMFRRFCWPTVSELLTRGLVAQAGSALDSGGYGLSGSLTVHCLLCAFK